MINNGMLIQIVERKSFWDEGVDRQVHARNLYNAKKQFDNSCMLCCLQNKRMSCDCCPIRNAFELNASIYADSVPSKYFELVLQDLEKR